MLTVCVALFKIEDHFLLSGLLLLAVSFTCKGMDFCTWNTLDWALGIFFLYNLCASISSANIYPSLLISKLSAEAFLVYILQKEILRIKYITPLQQFIFVIVCIVVLCIALLSFFVFAKEASNVGFEHLSNFRHLFRPFGYNTNAWNTVLILMLGLVACIVTNRKVRLVLSFVIILAMVLSFSRSAYIVVIMYIILNRVIVKNKQYNTELTATIAAAFFIGILLFSKDIISTISMVDTESHRRSIEGRLMAIREIWSIDREHLFLGYGTGNFTLAMDSFYGQDFTRTYTSYAPNILMKAVIERGILGLMAFAGMMGVIFITCWKNRTNNTALIAGITLFVTFIKEMSLSTISTIDFGWIAIAILLAFIRITEKNDTISSANKSRVIITSIICIFSFVTSTFWNIVNKNVVLSEFDIQKQFMRALDLNCKGYNEQAKEILISLTNKYPRNAQFSYQLYRIAYESGDKANALEYLTNSIKLAPRILTLPNIKHLINTDSIYYQHIKKECLRIYKHKESDPIISAYYGMLAYLLGDKPMAMSHITYSLKVLPNLPMPWLVRGLLLKERSCDTEAEKCIRKSVWLTNGFITKSPIENNEIPTLTERDLWGLYSLKYNEWYGRNINIKQYEISK